ncbi:MAG: Rieske (2Fe-2S) protein [Candidatus Nanopelagicales bacterium]
MSEIARRNVLAAGALGVAGVALVGCSSGGDTATETPTDQGGEQTMPASPATSGEGLVAVADVPLEGGVIVDSGQTKVVVTQPTQDDFVGLSAVCTHQGCLVNEVTDQRIVCPCHGSQFSITDGSVLQGPATSPLPPVAVKVDGDQVVLG